jgi:hypothetical protein
MNFGRALTLISTGGVAKTWALSTSATSSGSITAQTSPAMTTSGSSSASASAQSTTAASTGLSLPHPSGTTIPVTHGLIKGAKAGIGIGAAVGVLILSVKIYVVRLKRRASQTEKQSAAIQRDTNRECVIQELEPNVQVPNKGAGYTAGKVFLG